MKEKGTKLGVDQTPQCKVLKRAARKHRRPALTGGFSHTPSTEIRTNPLGKTDQYLGVPTGIAMPEIDDGYKMTERNAESTSPGTPIASLLSGTRDLSNEFGADEVEDPVEIAEILDRRSSMASEIVGVANDTLNWARDASSDTPLPPPPTTEQMSAAEIATRTQNNPLSAPMITTPAPTGNTEAYDDSTLFPRDPKSEEIPNVYNTGDNDHDEEPIDETQALDIDAADSDGRQIFTDVEVHGIIEESRNDRIVDGRIEGIVKRTPAKRISRINAAAVAGIALIIGGIVYRFNSNSHSDNNDEPTENTLTPALTHVDAVMGNDIETNTVQFAEAFIETMTSAPAQVIEASRDLIQEGLDVLIKIAEEIEDENIQIAQDLVGAAFNAAEQQRETEQFIEAGEVLLSTLISSIETAHQNQLTQQQDPEPAPAQVAELPSQPQTPAPTPTQSVASDSTIPETPTDISSLTTHGFSIPEPQQLSLILINLNFQERSYTNSGLQFSDLQSFNRDTNQDGQDDMYNWHLVENWALAVIYNSNQFGSVEEIQSQLSDFRRVRTAFKRHIERHLNVQTFNNLNQEQIAELWPSGDTIEDDFVRIILRAQEIRINTNGYYEQQREAAYTETCELRSQIEDKQAELDSIPKYRFIARSQRAREIERLQSELQTAQAKLQNIDNDTRLFANNYIEPQEDEIQQAAITPTQLGERVNNFSRETLIYFNFSSRILDNRKNEIARIQPRTISEELEKIRTEEFASMVEQNLLKVISGEVPREQVDHELVVLRDLIEERYS